MFVLNFITAIKLRKNISTGFIVVSKNIQHCIFLESALFTSVLSAFYAFWDAGKTDFQTLIFIHKQQKKEQII
ncbi:MAG: hypothetical protein EAZ44_07480 [Cytophagia bacterium]|nr:MAG: hypothetical protein EAZ44_07480 [Cytophagia bacterium]TAG40458.1 MAG: hypothetical protein EAZ31_08390 [Cytophagia bacterium]TAH29742.1 MAG: hypothetical protein EAZ06_05795 [Cytophagales bacterium]